MSTKIYDAYRFPRGKFEEFILLFNEICYKGVAKRIKKMAEDISEPTIMEAKKKIFGDNHKAREQVSDVDVGIAWIMAQWMLASKSPYKDMFDFDCSFNLWMRGRYCYVIPYLSSSGLNLRKALPEWCESYCYWNNTDPEDGISDSAWTARGRIWDEMTDDWDKSRLTHITMEMKMPNLSGFNSLLHKMSKDELWIHKVYSRSSALYWKIFQENEEKRKKKE